MFWSHDFSKRIVVAPDHLHVWLITKSGSFREFENPDLGGIYQTVVPADEYRSLEWLGGNGWALHDLDGTTTFFLASGLWSHTTDRNGHAIEGSYTGNDLTGVTFPDGRTLTLTYASSGKLASIVETPVSGSLESPRTWTYSWLAGNYGVQSLQKITLPDGRRWDFGYDGQVPPHLTRVRTQQAGVLNEPTRVEAAWEYDAAGQLWHAWRGAETFAAGWDKYTWNYISASETQVEDAYGNITTYLFEREPVSGKPRVTSVSSACPSCGLSPNSTLNYENPANPGHPLLPWTITDSSGTVTELTYTDFGQVESRTEALGDPGLERTTAFVYDPVRPAFATTVERPSVVPGCASNRQIVRSYGASNGNLESEARSGCQIVAGASLPISGDSTVYDFTGTTGGSPTSVDPPGFAASDVTEFDYDEDRGDQVLLSRTDPLVGVTHYGVDGFNRRVTVTGVNSVVVTTAYDTVDRVTSVTREGGTDGDDEVTSYFYNPFGDLFCVKMPRGNGIEYSYDTAGRRTAITRGTALGSPSSTQCLQTTGFRRERTSFTFNSSGQEISAQQEFCATGTCSGGFTAEARVEYVRTSRCHLDQVNQAKTLTPSLTFATTEYGYDCNGNLEKTWDANHPSAGGTAPASTVYKYDALNRMIEMRQPWGPTAADCDPNVPNDPDCVITTYGYDVQDHMTSVTDPEGTVTTFVYDDRDLLASQLSEVSGLTEYEYNLHRQLTTETDARAVVTNRIMDAADRIEFLDFVDDSHDVDYVYGTAIDPLDFTKGRLKQIVPYTAGDPITLNFKYDRFGRTKQDGELTRTFDKNGNLWTLTYPEGLVATYTYDFADREQTLAIDTGTGSQPIVSTAAYKANGPLASLTFATTPTPRTETRAFDARYLPSSIDVSPSLFHWDYEKDDVGNISTISQALPVGTPVRSYGYQDCQYFLNSAEGPWLGPLAWTYDKIGNRTEEWVGTLFRGFTYQQNSTSTGSTARLTSVCEQVDEVCPVLRTYTSDAGGYLEAVQAGANLIDFEFDAAGHLSSVDRGDKYRLENSYDGRGFLATAARTEPVSAISPTYSSQGLLFSLLRSWQKVERHNVLYFAGRPVATWKNIAGDKATTTYLTTDHLGTPVFALNQAGAEYWKGGLEPFGRDWQEGTPNDMLTKGIFLRFPGQWDDPDFTDPTLGADIYYNVHRWYEPQTGRYTRTDPLGIDGGFNPYFYADANPLRFIDRLGLVSSAGDCGCCSIQDQAQELRRIQNWMNQNGRNYRKRWASPSYGCGDAGDSVVWDVERQLQPKCWITRNQQLASPGRGLGLAINAVSYTLFGTNTWTHFVPTFRPCGSHGAPQDDLNADPYYGDDQLKPLSTSWRIDDLQDQPEIGPSCLWK